LFVLLFVSVYRRYAGMSQELEIGSAAGGFSRRSDITGECFIGDWIRYGYAYDRLYLCFKSMLCRYECPTWDPQHIPALYSFLSFLVGNLFVFPLAFLLSFPPLSCAIATLTVSLGANDLIRSVNYILMNSPRTMLWLPAMLRAAEILQVLVLDPAGAAEFQATTAQLQSEASAAGAALAHGSLESHVLLDLLHSVNSSLQPQRARPVRPLEHTSVHLS
jgi:hypothetical protein